MTLAVLTIDTGLFNNICDCMGADDISCRQFDDAMELARTICHEGFDAILTDAKIDIGLLRQLAERRSCYAARHVPLIVVGVSGERASVRELLDAGADDVVLAPIDLRVLTLRVRFAMHHLCRQASKLGDSVLRHGPYQLDRRFCMVTMHETSVQLTAREFAIVWLLFLHFGKYVSRRHIAGAVWSSSEDIVRRTLEQHIYKLRKKLKLNGTHGVRLRTVYGRGYQVWNGP